MLRTNLDKFLTTFLVTFVRKYKFQKIAVSKSTTDIQGDKQYFLVTKHSGLKWLLNRLFKEYIQSLLGSHSFILS